MGCVFGRLTAVEMQYVRGMDSKAVCVCACGKRIVALVYNLRNGNTLSCGCLARESRAAVGRRIGPIQGKKNATHGMSHTPTYASWLEARKRCFSPKNKRYEAYGGRGISMCQEWAVSFEAFFADMGEAPPGMTLDRKNPDGNYEHENCRWATKAEQARNTRRTRATWEIVRSMRARAALGETAKALASEYGMCLSNARSILYGVTWKE